MTRHSYTAPSSSRAALTTCLTTLTPSSSSSSSAPAAGKLREASIVSSIIDVGLRGRPCLYQVSQGRGLPPTTWHLRRRRSPSLRASPVTYPLMTGQPGASVGGADPPTIKIRQYQLSVYAIDPITHTKTKTKIHHKRGDFFCLLSPLRRKHSLAKFSQDTFHE